MTIFLYAFNLLCKIVIGMLFAQAILSWFINPYSTNRNGALARIYFMLTQITEPLVRPARKLLSRFRTGPVDFSLFLTMLFIIILEKIVIRIFALFL